MLFSCRSAPVTAGEPERAVRECASLHTGACGGACMDGCGGGARGVMEIAMRSTETEAGMLRMWYSELFNAGAALAANWMN